MPKKPKILILGAGFGGVYVAKKLLPQLHAGKIDVTIINRTNYFLFTPLLHEVATGALTPGSVAEPLREVFYGTQVQIIQGNVDVIDVVNRTVTVSGTPVSYDYLVIATGAETNYYGISGAEQFSYPLKNLYDATRIRSRIIDSFEKASLVDCGSDTNRECAERARLLSFAVVGGGATGVEIAAELAEFANGIARRYYRNMKLTPHDVQVSIIDSGPELLSMFAPKLRKSAENRLRNDGVAFHLNCLVTSVSAEGLTLSNHTTVPAATVIWSAGVKAIIPKFEGIQPTLIRGRLAVDEHFIMASSKNIFVLGDVAGYPTPFPMLAQVAQAQAKIISQNILASISEKPLHNFAYSSKGSMVSVGQWFAIGDIFSFKISGRLTWWLWRTVYLFKFASFKKRIRIVLEWSLAPFFPRDITEIVG